MTLDEYWERQRAGRHDTLELLLKQVQLQERYARAYSETMIARQLGAIAIREELKTSIDRVKATWEKRSIAEAEIMKRAYNQLKSQKVRNKKAWDRYENHPELSGSAIVKGSALNFLLHRLSRSILAYDVSVHQVDLRESKELELSPATLHDLNLKQSTVTGEQLVFRADEGVSLNMDFWPYSLREEKFTASREALVAKRNLIELQLKNGKATMQDVDDLEKLLDRLEHSFRRDAARNNPAKGGFASFKRFQMAQAFLTGLRSEIHRVQDTGNLKTFAGEMRFDINTHGSNVVDLVRFMARYGLEFAPAAPGGEASYQQVFGMIRDLYTTVAAEDASIQVEEE